jgi:hypothetical protein
MDLNWFSDLSGIVQICLLTVIFVLIFRSQSGNKSLREAVFGLNVSEEKITKIESIVNELKSEQASWKELSMLRWELMYLLKHCPENKTDIERKFERYTELGGNADVHWLYEEWSKKKITEKSTNSTESSSIF